MNIEKLINGDNAMAKRTDEQKIAQDAYMKKIKDIKLRVPEIYHQAIKDYAESKGMSINNLVISLLEKEMGIEILSIRKQNKSKKENAETKG